METKKVFVSHSHADKPFARRLVADLSARGVSFWFDELELSPGDSLIQRIQDAILEAPYFLVLLSRASVGSTWVKKELNAALALELKLDTKLVIPAVIDDCEVPTFLLEKLYVDFRTGYETGLLQLLKTLISSKSMRETAFIPAGKFLAGKKKNEAELERGIFIDVFPVTVGAYHRFVADTGTERSGFHPEHPPISSQKMLPVADLWPEDIFAYCEWRSRVEGRRVRLPSPLEWEKAARGEDDREFPWGEVKHEPIDLPEFMKPVMATRNVEDHTRTQLEDGRLDPQIFYCNCLEFVNLENRGVKERQAVDRFEHNVSPYGIRDMAANVWEVTATAGPQRIQLRGGSYSWSIQAATCYGSHDSGGSTRHWDVGFRCVTEP